MGPALRIPAQSPAWEDTHRCEKETDDKGMITDDKGTNGEYESALIQDDQVTVGASRGLPGGGGIEAKPYRARRSWPVIGARNGEKEFQAGGVACAKAWR